MARWEDALDAQLDLVVKHSSDDRTRAYTQGWMESYGKKMSWHPQGYSPEQMADRIAAMAFNADAIWVDPDMQTIWEGALEGFQPEPLVPEDLVCPAGFLYLPRPYYSIDVNGKRVATRAILWHPIEHVLMAEDVVRAHESSGLPLPEPYTFRMGDMLVPAERRGDQITAGGLMFFSFSSTADKDDYGWDEMKIRTGANFWNPLHGLVLNHFMPWPYRAFFELRKDEKSGERDLGALAVQALWRLMQQTLAVRAQARPDRATRKRLARARWPEREVTVVRLRRLEPEHVKSDSPKVVNWTHRWLVGGHWRMQPYPSLGITRQIWISPYVKGPEELPLQARKARVFELVR